MENISKERLRILVVGTKHGHNYIDAALKNPHWELAGIVARSQENRQEAAKKYQISSKLCFADLTTALDSLPDLNVVCITTPNEFHYTQSKEVLDRNLHLILEKPLVETWEQAVDLVKRLDAHPGKKATVGQTLRGNMPFRQIAYNLNQGIIGNISEMNFDSHWLWVDDPKKKWRFTLPEMWLEDIGIHHFDTIRMLLKNRKCVQITCESSTPKEYPLQYIHTTVKAQMTFEDQIVVNYYGSMAHKENRTEWSGDYTILGENGMIVKKRNKPTYVKLNNSWLKRRVTWTFGKQKSQALPFNKFHGIAYLLEDFYWAIHDNRPPICDLHDNLHSHAILMAMKLSAAEHRTVDVQKEFHM